MSPFESALAEESKFLACVIDQSFPSDPQAGRRTYIGPTAIDMSTVIDAEEKAARLRTIEADIRRREAGLFRSWRGQDFATHSFQQQRHSFRRPKRSD